MLVEVGDLDTAERTCAAALTGARDAGDLWSAANLLEKLVVLDLQSGRYPDAAVHLREAVQTGLRTGVLRKVLEDLDCCGYLCAWTGRPAEAVTVWAAVVALGREGFSVPSHPDLPEGSFHRQEPLREARQALGPAQTRVAEERGQAMTGVLTPEGLTAILRRGIFPRGVVHLRLGHLHAALAGRRGASV